MGRMRFLTPKGSRLSAEAIQRAYVVGLDLIPTPCRKARPDSSQFIVDRDIDESGNLHVLWPVDGHGQLLLSTSSLMEREQPYLLPLELARGTLNRLRTRAEFWRMGGLEITAELKTRIQSITQDFARAALSQKDSRDAAEQAERCLSGTLDAIVELGRQYAKQVLVLRHAESSPLNTLLIGKLGDSPMPENADPMFGAAFNAAICPFTWRIVQPRPDEFSWSLFDKQLALCRRHGQKVIGGPLLQLDRSVLPDWVFHEGSDFDTFIHRVRQYIQATVERYRDRVHIWHCTAGTNTRGSSTLSDEQRLRLTVHAIEAVRQADPKKPLIVSVDQPWGEYMTDGTHHLPPFHFAETLTRADLGIAGLGLEINYGYWPGGTLPRDILEITNHIDIWSSMGLPLVLLFTVPSGCGPDPLALQDSGRPMTQLSPQGVAPRTQRDLVERLFPILLAKLPVQGVAWDQCFDSCSHKYPHAGLFDSSDKPKPALSVLLELRRTHLD